MVTNFPGSTSTATYTTETNSSRYTQAEGVTPLYDGEGNLLFDGQHYFLYDFRNRLSEVYGVYQSGSFAAMSASTGSTATHGAYLTAGQARRVRLPDLATGRQELQNRASGNLAAWARQQRPGSAQLRSSSIAASGSAVQSSSTESATIEIQLEELYGYDPFNRRVARISTIIAENDFRYVYDGWREVEELALSGTSVIDRKASVWGHGIGELLSYQKTSGSGWAAYYPFQDEQGSVMRLLDGSGNTVERLDYDQYGKARYAWTGTPGLQSQSSVGNPWTYATGRLDEWTGLLYLRNRYLKVEFGRFCTVDPLGGWADSAGMGNAYCYGGNSAATRVDTSGLTSFPVFDPNGGSGEASAEAGGLGPDPGIVTDQGGGGAGGGGGDGKRCSGTKPPRGRTGPGADGVYGTDDDDLPGKSREDEAERNKAFERYSQIVGGKSCIACHQAPFDDLLIRHGLSSPSFSIHANGNPAADPNGYGPLAVAGVVGAAALAAVGTSMFAGCATAYNSCNTTRVFWAGRGAAGAAQAGAAEYGGATIGMTEIGAAANSMVRLGGDFRSTWAVASQMFAEGAEVAHAYISSSAPSSSLWFAVEEPTLLRMGVNIIRHLVP